jgi:hypothetical protein
MFRTLTAVAAWFSLAFIAYSTLSPLNERPEIGGLFLLSHSSTISREEICGGRAATATSITVAFSEGI